WTRRCGRSCTSSDVVRLRVQGAARGALTAGERGRLRRRAERMLRAAALTAGIEGAEVGLTLVGDTEIHELNRDYRKKDKPTDVLAFAMREGVGGELNPGELGDVVISVETA